MEACLWGKEFENYPTGAAYAVQTNAWMNGDVWRESFLQDLWRNHIDREQPGPLAISVDNFTCHSPDALAQLGTRSRSCFASGDAFVILNGMDDAHIAKNAWTPIALPLVNQWTWRLGMTTFQVDRLSNASAELFPARQTRR